MIIPGGRKTVSVILSKMKPNGTEQMGETRPEEEMNGSDGSLKAIADDIMMAFQSKSSHDLMTALKAFMKEIQNQDLDDDMTG
jgi:DNA phosphorothioation-dependent restriction protein DptG